MSHYRKKSREGCDVLLAMKINKNCDFFHAGKRCWLMRHTVWKSLRDFPCRLLNFHLQYLRAEKMKKNLSSNNQIFYFSSSNSHKCVLDIFICVKNYKLRSSFWKINYSLFPAKYYPMFACSLLISNSLFMFFFLSYRILRKFNNKKKIKFS